MSLRRVVAILLAGVLAVFVVRSCSKRAPTDAPSGPDPDAVWLATRSASAMAKVFRAAGLDPVDQGPAISVSGKTVNIDARIDAREQRDGQFILAAQIEILVGGARIPALTSGAVGVSDTAEHARTTTASEWAAQFGAPIGFALATRFGATAAPAGSDPIAPLYRPLTIDGQTLFHGPVGLRGEAKAPAAVSSDDFVRQVATLVVAELGKIPATGDYRSAIVQVLVTGAATTNGECRIDGIVSGPLFQAVSRLPWPEGSPSYMFKLFFAGPIKG